MKLERASLVEDQILESMAGVQKTMEAYLVPRKRRGSMNDFETATNTIDKQLKVVHGTNNKNAFQKSAHMCQRKVSSFAHAQQRRNDQRKLLFSREALRFDKDILCQLKRLALNADYDGNNEIDEDEFKTFYLCLFNVCKSLCPKTYSDLLRQKGATYDPVKDWKDEFDSCLVLGNSFLSISEFSLFTMKFVGQWTHYTKQEVVCFLQNTVAVLQRANMVKEEKELAEELAAAGRKKPPPDPPPPEDMLCPIATRGFSALEAVLEQVDDDSAPPHPAPPPSRLPHSPVVLRRPPSEQVEEGGVQEERIPLVGKALEASPLAPPPPRSPPPSRIAMGEGGEETVDQIVAKEIQVQEQCAGKTLLPQASSPLDPLANSSGVQKQNAVKPEPIPYVSPKVFSRYTHDGKVVTIAATSTSSTGPSKNRLTLGWTGEADTIFKAAGEITDHARDGFTGADAIRQSLRKTTPMPYSPIRDANLAGKAGRKYDGYPTMVSALKSYDYNQQGGQKSAYELHAEQLLGRHSRLRKARSLEIMKW
jgi:hypothetical protein